MLQSNDDAIVHYVDVPGFSLIVVQGEADLQHFAESLENSKEVAIDTETDGLYWARGNRPFMATFATSDTMAYAAYEPQLIRELLRIIDDQDATMIFHNAKFDFHMLREGYGWIPKGNYAAARFEDTMLAFRAAFPGKPAGLKIASNRYVTDIDVDGPQKAVKGWMSGARVRERIDGKYVVTKEPTFQDVPRALMLPYASQDVILTIRSWHGLIDALGTQKALYEREITLVSCLLDMERAGWPVNVDELKKRHLEARDEMDTAAREFSAIADGINPFSSLQLGRWLYEVKGFPPGHHKTPAGNYSVDESALEDIPDASIRALLLRVKKWQKAFTKYSELLTYLSSDNRLHCDYKQDGARTGRFSTTNPNLQNINRHDPQQRWTHIRSVFEAGPGNSLLFVDLSAIEMRLFAHYSKDPVLLEAFATGKDPHRLVSSLMYGIPPEKITDLQRSFGKGISFTILYGGGQNRVKDSLQYGAAANEALTREEALIALNTFTTAISEAERLSPWLPLAGHLLRAYKSALPSVTEFTRGASGTVAARWARHGRGWIRNVFDREVAIDQGRDYIATNALIQSTAADMLKIAMLRVAAALRGYCEQHSLTFGAEIKFFGSIHDELIFEVPQGHEEAIARIVAPELLVWSPRVMQDYSTNEGVRQTGLIVPIECEFSLARHGDSWADKIKLKTLSEELNAKYHF